MIINRPVEDMDRILSLPVVPTDRVYPDLTRALRRVGGTMTLRSVQNKALHIVAESRGGMLLIQVGGGKMLITILLPVYLRIPVAVLLIPAEMRSQLKARRVQYAKHFKAPARGQIHVITYTELSNPAKFEYLIRLKPQMIMADEADKLSNLLKSARCRRLRDYFSRYPDTIFVALSGTMVNDSIMNYAHLMNWALGDRSPLPLEHGNLHEWAQVLDYTPCPPTEDKVERLEELVKAFGEFTGDGQRDARLAYRNRLATCPGVLVSEESSYDGAVIIDTRRPAVPDTVAQALTMLDQAWVLPNGEETDSALEKTAQMNRLSCGFYYVWVWPKCRSCQGGGCVFCDNLGEIRDTQWLEAKRDWGRRSDNYLTYRSRTGVDSVKLLSELCQKWYTYHTENTRARRVAPSVAIPNELLTAWFNWQGQKHKTPPPTKAVWLDDYIVRDTVFAVRSLGEACIVWYSDSALGKALAAAMPKAVYLDTGSKANAKLVKLNDRGPGKVPTIIASIKAHGRGKDCQSWRENIVTMPPPNGRTQQQMIGRTARQGQESEWVRFTYNMATAQLRKNMRTARRKARMLEDTGNGVQRLNTAVYR